MSSDNETLKVYAEQAETYANLITGLAADPEIAKFLATLPPKADILDLGCGTGDAAAVMRDLGHSVTATDASPEMAQIARERYKLDVRIAEFTDLTDVAAYDGIWANFSLLHAPKAHMPNHLAAIHRALRPGGQLSLGLKTGKGEVRDRLGRFYAYYTDAEISGLLQTAGFTVTDRSVGKGVGLDGSIAAWIVVRAHG